MRARSLFLTLNRPDEEELAKVMLLHELLTPKKAAEREGAMRLCKEHWNDIAQAAGKTPHAHIAIFFPRQVTCHPAWKERYGLERAHFEPVLGTMSDAWDYIYKRGKDRETGLDRDPHREEWGEHVDEAFSFGDAHARRQGKRTDIDGAVDSIVAGATMSEIAAAHPVQTVKYHRGFSSLIQLLQKPRHLDMMPRCIVLHGATGSGKSARAWALSGTFPTGMFMKVASMEKWWDGYEGQEAIFLDEFRGAMTITDFLQMVDIHPWRSQSKGCSVHMQADTFIICSPNPPAKWWDWTEKEGLRDQLQRRLTENPFSRIYSTTLKCFTDIEGNALEDDPHWPAWLHPHCLEKEDQGDDDTLDLR